MPSKNSLHWTDIDGKKLYIKDFKNNKILSTKMLGRVSCIAPLISGGFIAAMENQLIKINQFHKKPRVLTEVFPIDPSTRLNDGKTDRGGNFFWVGSIFLPRDKKASGLWRYSSNGEIKRIVSNITTSNGLSWSPCGNIMYHSDSWSSKIWKYDYDTIKGEIKNKRIFYITSKKQGRPDGACVDISGYYWTACFNGGRILRISPEGVLDREFIVPMLRPTMIAFGGNNMNTLFVTSYGKNNIFERNNKEAGKLISIQTQIKGIAETLFKI